VSYKNKIIISFLISAFCLCLIGWADTLDDVKRELGKIKSLEAQFVQKKTTPILAKPLVSEGRMYFLAPSSIKWEYTSPFKDVLVVNQGKTVHYSFDKNGNKTVSDSGSMSQGMVFQEITGWMNGNFESKHFKATLKPGTPRVIVLTPRQKGITEFIRKIEMSLSDKPGVMNSIKIFEKENTVTLLEFRNAELNKKIDEAVFRIEE
jgi:outer membrane lipoprotein-sorting protein